MSDLIRNAGETAPIYGVSPLRRLLRWWAEGRAREVAFAHFALDAGHDPQTVAKMVGKRATEEALRERHP